MSEEKLKAAQADETEQEGADEISEEELEGVVGGLPSYYGRMDGVHAP